MASSFCSFVVLVLSATFVLCVSGHGEHSSSSCFVNVRFLREETQHDYVDTALSKDDTGGAVALDYVRGSVSGLWDAAWERLSQRRGRLLQDGGGFGGRKLSQNGGGFGGGRKLSGGACGRAGSDAECRNGRKLSESEGGHGRGGGGGRGRKLLQNGRKLSVSGGGRGGGRKLLQNGRKLSVSGGGRKLSGPACGRAGGTTGKDCKQGRKLLQNGRKLSESGGGRGGGGGFGRKLREEGEDGNMGIVEDVSTTVGDMLTAPPGGFENRKLAEVGLPNNDADSVTSGLN